MSYATDQCNVLCQPPDIHAEVIYGDPGETVDGIWTVGPVHGYGHRGGKALVLEYEPAVEMPPPTNPACVGLPAYLMTWQFVEPEVSP